MFNTEKISSQEFIERLNSGNLNPESMIFGKVKKSEKDSEVLFAFKGDKSNWIKIPADKIDHVHLIKSFTCAGEKMALVKIHLKKPADADAKLFHDLLSALQAKVMKWHMKKMMMCGCGSGEMKNNPESHYGHHSGCNWSQYK
ncbi:MAG: hypothetical protein ACXVC7_01260 [Bacteroidia bacterium]